MVITRFVSLMLIMLPKQILGLSLVHLQQRQNLQDRRNEVVHGVGDAVRNSIFSERYKRSFASIAARHDDSAMIRFVKRYLAEEDKFVAYDQEGELAGFVQWFDGTKAVQDFEQMQDELSNKTWVKDLKTVDGATLSEADYQAVAQNHNDTAMMLFINSLLKGENLFVPSEDQGELAGLVPWFSGTKATQSLENLRLELRGKPWVRENRPVELSVHASAAAADNRSSEDVRRDAGNTSNPNVQASGVAVGHSNREPVERGSKSHSADHHLVIQEAPTTKCSVCIIHGDAKVLSFSAYRSRAMAHPHKAVELYARKNTEDQFSGFDTGTYWVVSNEDVLIQGRYWPHTYNKPGVRLGALAISGPMVGNNTLVVRSLSGEVTWNGQEILGQASNFSNEFVEATSVPDAGPIAGNTHAPGCKFSFSNGVRLTVTRYRKHLAALIELCKSHVGASPITGQCGDLERTPRVQSRVWLAVQRAAEKLPRSAILFPDGLANAERENH